METSKIAALESLLFVAGDEGLTLEEVTTLLEVTPLEAHNLAASLKRKYEESLDSGLTLIETRRRYQLATKKAYSELIREYAVSPFSARLSQAALETLAIIAYRQPITRMEIDEIRGVQSQAMLQRLQLRGLVRDVGRSDTPGRPILYGTTDYFMNYFGLTDLNDLPSAEVLFHIQEEQAVNLFQTETESDNDFSLMEDFSAK